MFNAYSRKKKIPVGKEVAPEEIFMDSLNLPGHNRVAQEGRIERPIEGRVFSFWGIIVCAGLLVLSARLFQLQYVRGDEYLAASKQNISFTIFTAPPRGIIEDRNGTVLAENTSVFSLVLKKKDFRDDASFAAALQTAASLAGKSTAEIWRENRAADQTGDALPPDLGLRSVWPDEAVLARDIPQNVLLRVATEPADFPGVVIEELVRRVYPLNPSAFSHVVGFTGQPTADDQAHSDFYRVGGRIIGKSGVELTHEEELRGTPGRKVVEIDASGKPQRERFVTEAKPGDTLVLNIDAGLQSAAYEIMGQHLLEYGKKAGAVVVSDPRNGRILALVSYPGFDSQIFSDGSDRERIKSTLTANTAPFLNRAIAGVYAPGSTNKLVMATAALEEHVIDPAYKIYDEGFISVPNQYDPAHPSIFKDWSKLGWVDMRRAIAFSANVYFYTVGGGYGDIKGLGIDRIQKWLHTFGYGSPLGIDLPGEKGGLVPGPEEKKYTRPNDPTWRIGDTYISSIGQGDMGATPLQVNFATAAVANGGTLWRPFVTDKVVNPNGAVMSEVEPQAIREHIADPASLSIVREGMRMAVTEGSAKSLGDLPVAIAGKTGTAQTGVVGKNQGWFTGFAPYDHPEIAVTVLVEEGTGGSTDAVPIAKELFLRWIAEHAASTGGTP